MAEVIYNVLIYIFEMLIAFAFFSRKYNKKIKSNFTIILIGLFLFVPCALVFFLFTNEIINLTLFFLINFVFAILCFDISLKSAIIHSIVLDAIMYLSELLTIFLSSAVFEIPTSTYKTNFIAYIMLSSISKVLYFVLSQILSFTIKKDKLENSNTRHFLPLFIFPVLTLATCTVFLFIALDVTLSTTYQIILFVICVLFIFACIFIFIYYQVLLEKEAKINELESEQRINSVNQTYLDILEHQNNEFQILFHDMKNHYISLSNFENIEDVKNYIDKLYPSIETHNQIRISNNKMIDLILNKYIVLCKNNDIKFSYEVKTANLEYIDNVELSIILNNALDNAVESARESKEKIIELSLRHINNMDLLSIVNSCDIPPITQGEKLVTTKSQSKNHGFGSKIIEKHTKSNNGNYEWFYDEKEKRFHLSLLFKSK